MKKIALIVAAIIISSASANAQTMQRMSPEQAQAIAAQEAQAKQQKPATVTAQAAPAAEQPKAPSAKELAEKRVADWQGTKLPCYRKVQGATEGVHWRLNPANPSDIETHSSLWSTLPATVHAEFAKCKAIKVGQQQ